VRHLTNRLPRVLRDVLPADTARTWVLLRDRLPDSLVLYGGTALASHLHHRVSRDLDFSSVELDVPQLRSMLESLGTFAATTHDADTLGRGVQ
jgi:predicted nucleotidyltransferase component of viral defense system